MSQITIRQLGTELETRLRKLAQREGISLNRAAVKLLRRGAGIDETSKPHNTIGNALDEHIGSWTAVDERKFLRAIASTEAIDPAMWK